MRACTFLTQYSNSFLSSSSNIFLMKKLLRFFNTVTRTIETHQKTPTRGKRRKKKKKMCPFECCRKLPMCYYLVRLAMRLRRNEMSTAHSALQGKYYFPFPCQSHALCRHSSISMVDVVRLIRLF